LIESNVPVGTQDHSTKNDVQDVAKVIAVVIDKKLLDVQQGRAHKSFPDFKLNPLCKWDQDNTKERIKMKVKEFEKLTGAFREDGNGQDDLEDEDVDEDVYY